MSLECGPDRHQVVIGRVQPIVLDVTNGLQNRLGSGWKLPGGREGTTLEEFGNDLRVNEASGTDWGRRRLADLFYP
jgi:hypothetical protein